MAEVKKDCTGCTHHFIDDILGYKFKDEDFNIIRDVLIIRTVMIDEIEKSKIKPGDFMNLSGRDMVQPKIILEEEKAQMKRYVDWDCAITILRVIANYCELHSKE